MQGTENGVTPLGNEYFGNAAEGQNKAAELVGYIFPVPLSTMARINEHILPHSHNSIFT